MTLTPQNQNLLKATGRQSPGASLLGVADWMESYWGGRVIEMDEKGEMERDLGRFPGRKRVS